MATSRVVHLENYGDSQLSSRLKAPRPASASARTARARDAEVPMIMRMKKKYGNYLLPSAESDAGGQRAEGRQAPFLYRSSDKTQLKDGFRLGGNNNGDYEEVR